MSILESIDNLTGETEVAVQIMGNPYMHEYSIVINVIGRDTTSCEILLRNTVERKKLCKFEHSSKRE